MASLRGYLYSGGLRPELNASSPQSMANLASRCLGLAVKAFCGRLRQVGPQEGGLRDSLVG